LTNKLSERKTRLGLANPNPEKHLGRNSISSFENG
jgi:hypothetical protein